MSLLKHKLLQPIRRDRLGRMILIGGWCSKGQVLTEEQASELQLMFAEQEIKDKRSRRWQPLYVVFMFFLGTAVLRIAPDAFWLTAVLVLVIVGVGFFVSWRKYLRSPLNLKIEELQKSAPRV